MVAVPCVTAAPNQSGSDAPGTIRPRTTHRPRPLRDQFCLISRSLRTSTTPSIERASSPAAPWLVPVHEVGQLHHALLRLDVDLVRLVVESSMSFVLTEAVTVPSSMTCPVVACGLLTLRSLRTSLTPGHARDLRRLVLRRGLSTNPPSCTTPR